MDLPSYPSVSIVIPVLNEQDRIPACLNSVFQQDYPREKLEVLVIDGGSSDNTVKLAQQFPVTILSNPKKIAEYGKAIGIEHTDSQFFVLLDADNVIGQSNWLKQMIYPLLDNQSLLGSMSYYLDDPDDFYLNRYFTLMQATDPLARFLHPRFEIKQTEHYQIFKFDPSAPPPFGSNGFVWRRKAVQGLDWGEKFEEANMMAQVVGNGYCRFAKVSGCGVYHDYVNSWGQMIRKKIKIARKFTARTSRREQTWMDKHSRLRFYLGIVYLGTGIGPFFESLYHAFRTGAWPWLLHPMVSMITITVYGLVKLNIISRA